ncbi:hypothetical protein C819_01678 [Lachnospiraceae bacterium 10-1]|nr:hypothetical protein C819_01678 [Lachnospiraceae bacterium 10-1]
MSRGKSTCVLLKVSKKAMNNPQKTLGEILMIRIAIVEYAKKTAYLVRHLVSAVCG